MKSVHSSPSLLALLLATLLAGCAAVGPEHHVPDVATGDGWIGGTSAPVDSDTLTQWWTTFHDADLDRLVEQALAHNFDLRQADLAVAAARAQLGKADAAFAPGLSAKASSQANHASRNSPEYNPQRSADTTVNDIGLDASWEIDLFGSLRRQRESAAANAAVSAADASALRMSIAAETARTYFTLRGAQRELAARQTSVAALQRTLSLIQQRRQAGDVADADVERAQARLDQARALLPGIAARQQAAVIALGLLTGGLPESHLALVSNTGQDIELRAIPLGTRADILRRRPDIASAERKLAAATADVGVATAELFPKLTLSAGAGFRALSGAALIADDSRRSSLLPLISWRIFDGGRVRAEIHAAEARQQAAAVGYEKAVLSALGDAEKAVSQYTHSLASVDAQSTAVTSTLRVAATTQRRYDLGDASLVDALDSQRELADQQAALAQVRTQAATDMVTLYKSLGGGWEATPEIRE